MIIPLHIRLKLTQPFHFAGESTDALQTSGLSAFTASKSYNFILAAALFLSASVSGTAA